MENRFGIQYLQLDPYLLDQSDDELKCEPTFDMVTEKGKNDDGSLNKNGLLQMYILDLECFHENVNGDGIKCSRRKPPEKFKFENRAKFIEEIAHELSMYDKICGNAHDEYADRFEEETRQEVTEGKEAICYLLEIIRGVFTCWGRAGAGTMPRTFH